jgi:hypothetical protein
MSVARKRPTGKRVHVFEKQSVSAFAHVAMLGKGEWCYHNIHSQCMTSTFQASSSGSTA